MAFGMTSAASVAGSVVKQGSGLFVSKLLWWAVGVLSLVIIVGGSFGWVAYSNAVTELDKTKVTLESYRVALDKTVEINTRLGLQMQALNDVIAANEEVVKGYQESLQVLEAKYDDLIRTFPKSIPSASLPAQTKAQQANAKARIDGLWEIYCMSTSLKECKP